MQIRNRLNHTPTYMLPINVRLSKQKQLLQTICFLCLIFLNSDLNSQTLTKTTKLSSSGNPVKNTYYNDKFEIVKEEIFDVSNKIISTLEYDPKGVIKKVTGYKDGIIYYNYDVEKGSYFSKDDNVNINFGPNGFDGKQATDGIFVSYKNNQKDGKVILADSAVVGNKIVKVYKVDLYALQHDIIRYYQDFEKAPLIKQFNGYFLTFEQGKLNGIQRSYYENGHLKFEANFEDGTPKYFNSYANDGSCISKILFENGITVSPFILNGSLHKDRWVFVFNKLAHVGDIIKANWEKGAKMKTGMKMQAILMKQKSILMSKYLSNIKCLGLIFRNLILTSLKISLKNIKSRIQPL